MANTHPVILVHGLFGWGPGEVADFPYWGTGRTAPCPLPRREAKVGPISSMHDRACELAFQLRGGRVDYGKAHAARAGHERYGRTYDGDAVLHPGWSARRPVHLVGHSMGAPTAVLLQQLLEEDAFGWGSNHRWVASISSISGALNGSTATYFFGCSERTGLLKPDSIGDNLAHALEVTLRATGSSFDDFYDFELDQWGLGADRGEPLEDYVARIAASPMFRGKDNGAYSLTIQGLLEQNARCRTYPGSYYFSYVTEQTRAGFLTGHHYPDIDMNPLLVPTAIYIGSMHPNRPFYPEYRAQDWWPNDGLVSVYSQQFPRTAGHHPVGGVIDDATGFRRGRWYHQLLDDVDHIDIVALPQPHQIPRQRAFYTSLFARLATL